MTDEKEPPARVWIEDNDSDRYYDHPLKFSKGIEYVRADLLATVRAEEREAAFKLIRDKLVNSHPRSILADIAELVSGTAPHSEAKCEHGIPWSMECLNCGLPEYVAATKSREE